MYAAAIYQQSNLLSTSPGKLTHPPLQRCIGVHESAQVRKSAALESSYCVSVVLVVQ